MEGIRSSYSQDPLDHANSRYPQPTGTNSSQQNVPSSVTTMDSSYQSRISNEDNSNNNTCAPNMTLYHRRQQYQHSNSNDSDDASPHSRQLHLQGAGLVLNPDSPSLRAHKTNTDSPSTRTHKSLFQQQQQQQQIPSPPKMVTTKDISNRPDSKGTNKPRSPGKKKDALADWDPFYEE
jgi:hypothetical protein